MECSPGLENWKQYNKMKEIGMDKLASMQAVAHGGGIRTPPVKQ